MSELSVTASPHSHDHSSVDKIMLQVCVALMPVTGWAFYLFGWSAVIIWSLTCVAAIVSEAMCLMIRHESLTRLYDGSALLTGWLLALTLPPSCPWWIAVGGGAFAIVIGKQIYGGIGQNLFNPALLARVALLISFPVPLTTWLAPETSMSFAEAAAVIFGQAPLTDAMTGATWLGDSKAAVTAGGSMTDYMASHFDLSKAFWGFSYGSMGEVSAALALIGGLWLMIRRIISWHIPVSMLGTLALLAAIFSIGDDHFYPDTLFHLLTGGVMLGAFFYATDYVTSPTSKLGQLIFGASCGLLIFVIRSYGSFPEAVAFGILFMNAFTPLIDRVTQPRVYGRTRTGKPIKHISAKRRVQ